MRLFFSTKYQFLAPLEAKKWPKIPKIAIRNEWEKQAKSETQRLRKYCNIHKQTDTHPSWVVSSCFFYPSVSTCDIDGGHVWRAGLAPSRWLLTWHAALPVATNIPPTSTVGTRVCVTQLDASPCLRLVTPSPTSIYLFVPLDVVFFFSPSPLRFAVCLSPETPACFLEIKRFTCSAGFPPSTFMSCHYSVWERAIGRDRKSKVRGI